jgi:hypothetical protein
MPQPPLREAAQQTPQTLFLKPGFLWLALSLLIPAAYAVSVLPTFLNPPYAVQDDARVYLIWMQRFTDPELLRGDWMADYLQSVTPRGYAAVYQLFTLLGIPPLLFSKLLPLLLTLAFSFFCYQFCLSLLPVPAGAFAGTLLLNQALWLRDDIVSANPRSYLYPLMLAFLYLMVRQRWLLANMVMVAMGLFFPIALLLAAGLMALQIAVSLWQRRRGVPYCFGWTTLTRRDFLFCLGGLAAALAVMLGYASHESQFGPAVTAAQARTWVEFTMQGRIPFFDTENPLRGLFAGRHSGIRLSLNPPLLGLSFLLPLLLAFPRRFPVVQRIHPGIILLLQLALVSFGWFVLAYLLLFRLYHPSRYTVHTLLIVMAVAAGLTFGILWETVWERMKQSPQNRTKLWLTAVLVMGLVLVAYPHLAWSKSFPNDRVVIGEAPAIYQFLRQQPRDTVVASLAVESDNIPIFALRTTLVAQEYGNPYHVGYYREFRKRASDLVRAQYSASPAVVKQFIDQYQIDFWLIENNAFSPEYLEGDRWRRQYEPAVGEAVAAMQRGEVSLLQQGGDRCTVARDPRFALVSSQCIVNLSGL